MWFDSPRTICWCHSVSFCWWRMNIVEFSLHFKISGRWLLVFIPSWWLEGNMLIWGFAVIMAAGVSKYLSIHCTQWLQHQSIPEGVVFTVYDSLCHRVKKWWHEDLNQKWLCWINNTKLLGIIEKVKKILEPSKTVPCYHYYKVTDRAIKYYFKEM